MEISLRTSRSHHWRGWRPSLTPDPLPRPSDYRVTSLIGASHPADRVDEDLLKRWIVMGLLGVPQGNAGHPRLRVLDRPDADYWLGAAMAYTEFEAWQQEKAQAKR